MVLIILSSFRMKDTVHIQTFGCKVNYHDSSLIRQKLLEKGFNSSLKNNKITVLNTCAVTHKAGKEALRMANKIKREDPENLVIVTGCGAQADTELYEKSKSVDLIIGNSHREKLPDILKDFLNSHHEKAIQKTFKSNIFKTSSIYNGSLFPEWDRTRVFLKIQDGCNSFCTFCIIPFARGKSRSLKINDIVEKAIHLTEQEDIKEIVLTGVHIGDYQDEKKDLGDLIQILLSKTKLKRIRLSSLEPVEITEKLLNCYQEERVCPHFHLSIQSASSSVLQSMKRKYGRKDVEKSFHIIANKVPGAFVGIDLIAGFPSETQADFEETYSVLKETPWTKIHVFPYSPRPGTFSVRQKGLSRAEILKRASFFRRLSDFRYKQAMKQQIGTQKKVLLFKINNQKGLSRDYWNVHINEETASLSGEVSVIIKGTTEKALTGSLSS